MASQRSRAAAEPESDEDDYVFYGTKLYDEEGLATALPTGKVDPATTRSLPVHQQVATDEQGRKRFHGAFTGGFSAGYYNTVGSKVGIVGAARYASTCAVCSCSCSWERESTTCVMSADDILCCLTQAPARSSNIHLKSMQNAVLPPEPRPFSCPALPTVAAH
jgi:hypothetical protein